MGKIGIEDRRAHRRHDTSVNLQGTSDEGGVVARMVTRNLSLGGLYCTSTTDFAEMTRLAVRLMLPNGGGDEAPLDLEAVVVRREELPSSNGNPRYDLALYFTNLDVPARERIQSFLAERDL